MVALRQPHTPIPAPRIPQMTHTAIIEERALLVRQRIKGDISHGLFCARMAMLVAHEQRLQPS